MPQPPCEVEIDLMSGDFYTGDPAAAFAWMRAHDPVYFDEKNDLWGIATYRDVRAVSADTQTFSSAGGSRPKIGPLPMMIDMDAPEHVRRRRLVSAGFTPRRIQSLKERARETCDEIIDQVCEAGQCDFVADIATPLPLAMIGDMLGFAREDRGSLLEWSEEMLLSQGAPDPGALEVAVEAFGKYAAYMQPIVERRRSTGSVDDLVGVLCAARVDGDALDDASVIYETLLILIGGDETTRHVISGGMAELLAHPDQLARLRRDPSTLGRAVDEMLRWVSPIKNMARTATADTELSSRRIRRGDQVLLLYPSANRDEAVFDHPESFDTTRDPNPHVAFGFGAHFCLGNQLARLELAVMFERLLARLPDISWASSEPASQRRSNFISGLDSLAVAFTPSPVLGGATSP